MHHPTDRISHTTAFVTPVVEHWLEREILPLGVGCRTISVVEQFRLSHRREREKNVLLNDALNTFYLRLYGVRHMVKDHSDNEKGNPLPPQRLLLSINSKGSFICTIPQTGYHIPRPLLHQSWSTGWNEKYCRSESVVEQFRLSHGRERERNVLLNDALNTFYLRLYGVRHMVKYNSDNEKGNPLPPHRLLLSINSKGSFICTIPQTG